MGTGASKNTGAPPAGDIPPPPPAKAAAKAAALHRDDTDEQDESVKQLEECSAVYLALQECLVRTDRNWKSCQPEVQALKACHARRNRSSTGEHTKN